MFVQFRGGISLAKAVVIAPKAHLRSRQKNIVVSLRAVRVCLSVCLCESFLERSDLLSQRDRKPFNTALDRYNLARFTPSNRP